MLKYPRHCCLGQCSALFLDSNVNTVHNSHSIAPIFWSMSKNFLLDF